MHSPGHWIGLDVHDVGNYKKNNKWCEFKENMCLTVEPGIYINKYDLSVHEKWPDACIQVFGAQLLLEKQTYEYK